MKLDDVAWDDEQEPLGDTGPCEFGTGAVTFNPAPVVALCRKPGRVRDDVTWIEMYACDDCYERWRLARARERK